MNKTIICYIATLTRGGAERVMAGLANYMESNGFTVYLVTLEPQEGLYPLNPGIRQVVLTDEGPVRNSDFPDDGIKYLDKKYPVKNSRKRNYPDKTLQNENCQNENCQEKNNPDITPENVTDVSLIKRLTNAIGRITKLRYIIKKTGACSILSFMGKTNLRAIMASRGTGARCCVSVRSAPEKEYPGAFRGMLAKLLFCFADSIIFQSQGAMNFFPRACHKKARIIFNPLDKAFFEVDDTELASLSFKVDDTEPASLSFKGNDTEPTSLGFKGNDTEPASLRVVTAGRLSAIKNHGLLIRAFSIFQRKFPDYTLTIYGEGEERAGLEDLIDHLKLKNKVFLPGDERNVKGKMTGASLFVLSSDFEGMPNAIAEAMALKIPVVATNAPSGGIKALVGDNERGLLVPKGDEREMAKAMERIVTDKELRNNLISKAFDFSGELHPDIIYKQWLDFIVKD